MLSIWPTSTFEKSNEEQIVSVKADDKKHDISFDILQTIIPPTETTTSHRDYLRIPVATRDNRVIMYYLKRPVILQIRLHNFVNNNPLVPRLILSN